MLAWWVPVSSRFQVEALVGQSPERARIAQSHRHVIGVVVGLVILDEPLRGGEAGGEVEAHPV